MTFAYPILLGGLILAGLPVLLHFLIRQKPRVLPFPAFRFLMLQRRTNTRKLQLRHWLLMLLRIALLALICLALARPRLFQEQIGDFLSRERPVTLILVFDTSPSMDYRSNDMTRLDLAKKRSLELLEQLPEDCRALILETGSAEQNAREVWLRSLEKARQRIGSLAIRPEPVPVTQTLQLALQRIEDWQRSDEDPEGQRLPRFLCVFSDRTRPSWDLDQAALVQKRLQQETDVKLQTLYFDVGIDTPEDLAITNLELPGSAVGEERQSFVAGEKIPLRATVKATGKGVASTLLCQIDKGKPLQQAFDVPADGQQALTFEIDTAALGLKAGLHQAEVKLETAVDALAFNNQRFVTFAIADPPKVLVLAGDVKKAQTFAAALSALHYDVDVRPVQEKDLALSKYAAVFLDGVAAPSQTVWQTLTTYVEKGGGLGIIPPGDDLQVKAYNSEAARKIMPAKIGAKVSSTTERKSSRWDLYLMDDWQHPFLRPYIAWHEQRNNDIIASPSRAAYYWGVSAYKEQNCTVVMKYEDDRPAVVVRRSDKGEGKVLLLTTPMDQQAPKEEWNDYRRNETSFYVGLTMMCARYLCKEAQKVRLNYPFGSPPPVLTQGEPFPAYLLNGPDFSEAIRFDNRRWVGSHLPRAGNYVLSGTNAEKTDAKTITKFSVNIPGTESDLSRLSAENIADALGAKALIPLDQRSSMRDVMPDYWNEPMELFPWLMLLLLLLFALENLLANRFYKREPGI